MLGRIGSLIGGLVTRLQIKKWIVNIINQIQLKGTTGLFASACLSSVRALRQKSGKENDGENEKESSAAAGVVLDVVQGSAKSESTIRSRMSSSSWSDTSKSEEVITEVSS